MTMDAAPPSYLATVASTFRALGRNRELRRLQLAFAAFSAAEWAVWMAMLVYAYGRGGATTAAIVAAAQLVPATIVAPWAAVLGDRFPPGRVLAAGYLGQAAGMAATAAVLLADGPALAAYACAAGAATAVTITRPTQAALTPALARAPAELTAANAVAGWIESVSVLVAPALTGALLALTEPGAVFAVMAGATVVAAWLVRPLGGIPPATAHDEGGEAGLRAGLRFVRGDRNARLLMALLGIQYVAIGALDVLYVELAIGDLGRGGAWAAYLNAAFGLGGTLALAGTVVLVGRQRLAPALVLSIGVWMASLIGLALHVTAFSALLLFAVVGASHSSFDVASRTLLQRVARPDLLARVFGLLEGLSMAGLALGSLLVPVCLRLGGTTLALVVTACLLPAVAVLAGLRLWRIDRDATVPVVEIALLRRVALLRALPPETLTALARALVPVAAAPGELVVEQGEPGDRYYVVEEGELEVARDGATLARLGRADGFGEIALLADCPRTATVRALTPCRLYALPGDLFRAAVTGHPTARTAAAALVGERTGAAAPALGG